MTVIQRAVYTLAERDGDVLTLDAEITQRLPGDGRDMELAGLPPGAEVDISRMDSSGSARSVLDLTRPMPDDANVTMHMEMDMSVSVEGSAQEMDMVLDIELWMESPE